MDDLQKDKTIRLSRFLILCLMVNFYQVTVYGQSQNDTKDTKVRVLNADSWAYNNEGDKPTQIFKGNVRITHDSVFMFCDTAWLTEKKLSAVDSIVIIQSDTIFIFSDSLFYDGEAKVAELYRNVVLDNGRKKLFAPALTYEFSEKIATYIDTSILVSDAYNLSSIKGQYFLRQNMAYFEEEVVAVGPDLKLVTDSLRFDTKADKVIFIGPTYITQGDKRIYCERGHYFLQDKQGIFTQNAFIFDDGHWATANSILYSGQDSLIVLKGQAVIKDSTSIGRGHSIIIDQKDSTTHIKGNGYFKSDDRVVTGQEILFSSRTESLQVYGRGFVESSTGTLKSDSLKYEKSTDLGIAKGEVVWRDSTGEKTLLGDILLYRDSTSFFKSYVSKERPLYIQVIDGDTLFISADTLTGQEIVAEDGHDSLFVFNASGDVRLFKNDFQGRCDSLYYTEEDSTFTLYYDPVLWSDSSQFSGDTIILVLDDGALSDVHIKKKAFIITKVDVDLFDQIKGFSIHTILDSQAIERMIVKMNAESIYMVKDEDEAYIGVNKTKSSSMTFYFLNKDLDFIHYYGKPDSRLIPFEQAQRSDLIFDDFVWREEIRPRHYSEVRTSLPQKRRQQGRPVMTRDTFTDEVDSILQSSKRSGESTGSPKSKR